MTRSEIEEGRAWARHTLRKPEPVAPERKLSSAERVAAWLAQNREAEAKDTPTRSSIKQTRRDLHVPGTAYQVGDQRYAADGTLWRRCG